MFRISFKMVTEVVMVHDIMFFLFNERSLEIIIVQTEKWTIDFEMIYIYNYDYLYNGHNTHVNISFQYNRGK